MLNTNQVNGIRLNGIEPLTASGTLISFGQIVGKIYSARIVRFSQQVKIRETASGNLIGFEQSCETTGSGRLINIVQLVL